MRIYAIQTGAVRVRQRRSPGKRKGLLRLVSTRADRSRTDPKPMFAWLIEHSEGLIVVDTGQTARGSEPGYSATWDPCCRWDMQCSVGPEEEIGPKLTALGFSPDDVRWVVLTHLHSDHAGGLHHFPNAEILCSRRAYLAADLARKTAVRGFLPHRWPFWFRPTLVDFIDGPVGPFPASEVLTEGGDVFLVPTPGHTPGHLSLLVDADPTFFFAGDASYTEGSMLKGFVDGVSTDVRSAHRTLLRIRRFVSENPTVYLPAHDPESALRLDSHSTMAATAAGAVRV